MRQEREDRLTCGARVLNRIGADIKQDDSVVVKLLSSRLAARLGCDENLDSEALFRLAAIIFGLFSGAQQYLNSVDLHG
jgi:hypothetical protein